VVAHQMSREDNGPFRAIVIASGFSARRPVVVEHQRERGSGTVHAAVARGCWNSPSARSRPVRPPGGRLPYQKELPGGSLRLRRLGRNRVVGTRCYRAFSSPRQGTARAFPVLQLSMTFTEHGLLPPPTSRAGLSAQAASNSAWATAPGTSTLSRGREEPPAFSVFGGVRNPPLPELRRSMSALLSSTPNFVKPG